jgi:hypothetical protein
MRDFDAIIAVNTGNPDSKLSKQVAAAKAKAARAPRTPEEILTKTIADFEKKVADRRKWAEECRAEGQLNEAERWERWIADYAEPWLASQRKNLEALRG